MKRLLTLFVLVLALSGLVVPGLMAQGLPGHCKRGTLWTHSQPAAGLPMTVNPLGLPAPVRLSICTEQAIVAATAQLPVASRPVLPVPETRRPPPLRPAEAELPPPRG